MNNGMPTTEEGNVVLSIDGCTYFWPEGLFFRK